MLNCGYYVISVFFPECEISPMWGTLGPSCRNRDAIAMVACRHGNACTSVKSRLARWRMCWSFRWRRSHKQCRQLANGYRRKRDEDLFSTKWNLACIQKANRSTCMATTGTEITLEPVAIEWYQRNVQELTDLTTSHHVAFVELRWVIWGSWRPRWLAQRDHVDSNIRAARTAGAS